MSLAMLKKEADAVPVPVVGSGENSRPLRELLPLSECPALSDALAGPDGARLAREIEALIGSRLRPRAHRRRLRRMARLQCDGYDEVVMLKDVSATGVRLLVRGDQALDLRRTVDMRLVVQLANTRCVMPMALVRLCGLEGAHIDLGFRLLVTADEGERFVDEIRSHFFAG
jgi:hypothetical protein